MSDPWGGAPRVGGLPPAAATGAAMAASTAAKVAPKVAAAGRSSTPPPKPRVEGSDALSATNGAGAASSGALGVAGTTGSKELRQGSHELEVTPQHADSITNFTWLWGQVLLLQVVKMWLAASKATATRSQALMWLALMGSGCAAAVLLPERGESTLYLAASAVLVLWFTGSQSNHVFMELAVCLAVLLTYSTDRGRWRAQLAHAMQSFLVTLYWITAVHKLNSDWHDKSWSCCVHMLGGILAVRPLNSFVALAPISSGSYIAAATELGLPLLLLRQTDWSLRAATAWAALFHLPICLMLPPMSVYPFSVLMAPLYVFVIPGHVEATVGRLTRGASAVGVLAVAALAQRWTHWMAPELPAGQEPFEYPPYGCWAAGVVWCVAVYSALLYASLAGRGTAAAAVRPTWRSRMLALGVFAFGACPYLGIRNYPALAMFCNLRTEAGRSNHLFLGDDFDLIGWQRDYVTIHETDIRALYLAQVDLSPLYTNTTKAMLQHIGSEDEFWLTPPLEAWPYEYTRATWKPYSMPFLELRRRLAPLAKANATGRVRYTRTLAKAQLRYPALWHWLGKENLDQDVVVRDNVTYDLVAKGDPEVEEPLPWWLAALARWRTFDLSYSPCRH